MGDWSKKRPGYDEIRKIMNRDDHTNYHEADCGLCATINALLDRNEVAPSGKPRNAFEGQLHDVVVIVASTERTVSEDGVETYPVTKCYRFDWEGTPEELAELIEDHPKCVASENLRGVKNKEGS